MGRPSKRDASATCSVDVTPTMEEFDSESSNDIQISSKYCDKLLYGTVPDKKKSLCPCCSGQNIDHQNENESTSKEIEEYDNNGVSFNVHTEFLILQEDPENSSSTGPKKRGRKKRKLLESNLKNEKQRLLSGISIPIWRFVDDYDLDVEVEEEIDPDEPTDERILKKHNIHELEEKIRHNWENKPFIKKLQVQLRKLIAEITVKNPKGRGRKPKKFLQSLQINYKPTVSTPVTNSEPTAKRKRGRPRKYPKPDELQKDILDSEQSTCLVSTTTEEKTFIEDQDLQKEEDSTLIPTTVKTDSDIQLMDQISNEIIEKPKRKRGRPPKLPKLVKIPENKISQEKISVTVTVDKESSLDPHLMNWKVFDNLQMNTENVTDTFLNETYSFHNGIPIYNPQTTLDMSLDQYIQLASAINQTLNAPTPPSNSFNSQILPEVVPFTIELF